MNKINIHEAKTQLSRILANIEKTGEPTLICRNGVPVAQLSPCPGVSKPSIFQVREDLKPYFAPGFDPSAPANDLEWPEEHR